MILGLKKAFTLRATADKLPVNSMRIRPYLTFSLVLVFCTFSLSLDGCSRVAYSFEKLKTTIIAKISGDSIVATVGGYPITQSEIERHYREIYPSQTARLQSEQDRRKWFSSYLGQRAVTILAFQRGEDKSDTYKNMTQSIQEQALLSALHDDALANEIKVGNEEITQYYVVHYKSQKAIKVRRIDSLSISAARKSRSDLMSKKNSFKITNARSKDEIVVYMPGQLPTDIESKIFNLHKGQISEVIKIGLTYAVFCKLDETVTISHPFDTVKDEIRERLIRQKYPEWLRTELQKVPIKIDDKLSDEIFASLKSATQPPREQSSLTTPATKDLGNPR